MRVFIESLQTGEVLKRCSKCEKYKKLDEYHKHKHAPKGVQSECKICTLEPKRKYRSYEDWFWKRFWKRVTRVGDCLEWQGVYCGKVPVCGWKGKNHVSLRRIVYRLALGDVPVDMFVITTCENHRCVRQSHLGLATKEDVDVRRLNSMPVGDRHSSRTHPERVARGERVSSARLIEEEVLQIWDLLSRGMKLELIAQQFGVTIHAISSILRKRTWKHIEVPEIQRPDTRARGERCGRPKLTVTDIQWIRAAYKAGVSKREIARCVGVSPTNVCNILNGKAWAHVQ